MSLTQGVLETLQTNAPIMTYLSRIVGSTNEDVVFIEGVQAKALIGSGSMISTFSVDFCNQLSSCPVIHPLQELEIEGANGQHVPYLGYIEAMVEVPFLENAPMYIPMLVSQ